MTSRRMTIVLGEAIAAHGGDAAVVDGLFPSGDVAEILGVDVLDAADGGDAHAVEVGAGFGGVALEIAMEGAIALGDRQFVVFLGEVVHADVEIAGLREISISRCGKCRICSCLREGT